MKRKVVFMFLNGAITEPQRQEMDLGASVMIFQGVGGYDQACEKARGFVEEGVYIIELCGGFGAKGHAAVIDAVENKVPVGVVRYDSFPGYEHKSGDSRWFKG
ncbi:MAG TPA: hypothetical protein GX726_04455 [Clostridiales bacterium]|jgi:hypothetical protein|nr:hypothetical protein [Clostridiales bacterium]